MSRGRTAWYFFILNLVRWGFFRLILGGLKSIDEANVPRTGALIIAPIHVSNFDPPAVSCGTNRRMRFMAKEELFDHKIFGWLIRSLGAFPVKRGEGDTEAIRNAMKLLDEGEAVLMFPEGTRGDGQRMLPINKGVAMIAKRTGAMVLPVGIVGTHVAMPKGANKLRRHKVTLVYGKPFTYAEIAKDLSDREARAKFAEVLGDRIRECCQKGGLEIKSAETDEAPKASESAEITT